MKAAQHVTNNAWLGAPPDMTKEQCVGLPITRVNYTDGTEGVWSYWRPSEEERAAIAAGADVCLRVMGRTHAPLLVAVDGIEPEGA